MLILTSIWTFLKGLMNKDYQCLEITFSIKKGKIGYGDKKSGGHINVKDYVTFMWKNLG